MIIILPSKKENKREPDIKQVKSAATDKPKDWPFMEQSGKVLDDIPDTWLAYPDTEKGRMDIIKMEYRELCDALTVEEKMHELVHVASACLYLWRCLNDKYSAS